MVDMLVSEHLSEKSKEVDSSDIVPLLLKLNKHL
jgi:hypothetical protein